jgi:hypothetical protein
MSQRFDSSVLRALEKWPDVPACYGWLRLDRRGRWLINDETISHRGTVDFLSRNYANDKRGQWYVQNGPQRAYCSLDYTPWIYHLDGLDELFTHTENKAHELKGLVIDDAGDLLFETEYGIGLLQDRDLSRFIECLDKQTRDAVRGDGVASLFASVAAGSEHDIKLYWRGAQVKVRGMRALDVPASFGFVTVPAPGPLAEP